ncbi:hypothetical protein ABFS83_10G119200 [Erythranthe nasuta]
MVFLDNYFQVKDGGKVTTFAASSCNLCSNIIGVGSNYSEKFDMFSGAAAFAISPPPSSLLLPTFSVRPKALISCCKAEAAAGIDTGATDNHRRMNMPDLFPRSLIHHIILI